MTLLSGLVAGTLTLSQIVIGHRGLGAEHSPQPENSTVALVEALKDGANAVEFDVQLTQDGQVILAHDPALERMTTGKGCVGSQTYQELAKLWLRDGKGKPTTERPSLFSDTLKAIRSFDSGQRLFLADIHIKVYDGLKGDWAGIVNPCPKTNYAELTRKVLEITREAGLVDRVLFTSFDQRVLELVRKLEPTAKVGLLADYRTTHALSKAIVGNYNAVAFHFKHFSSDEVRQAHQHGIAFYAWSPAEEPAMSKLFAEYQIDGVITDNLPNALQACKKSCYR